MDKRGERIGAGQLGATPRPAHLALPPPRGTRGRHLRRRRRTELLRRVGTVLAVVVMLAVLVQLARLIDPSGQAATTTEVTAGPPSSAAPVRPSAQLPPGSGVLGNLVLNWSFEQDLSGWTVIGAAEGDRQTGGRTSGSAARIDARGSGPIGLALPTVITGAAAGKRYVATAWIRSNSPGTPVTLRLVSTPPNGEPEVSQAVARSPKGTRWSRATVAHQVKADGSAIRFELTTTGSSLVVDEVTIREG